MELSISHDALFIAIIGLLGAMVASPVLIAFAQNVMLKKRSNSKEMLAELRKISRLLTHHLSNDKDKEGE